MIRIAILISMLFSSSVALAEEDADLAAMPDGEGKDFVYLVCADCHSMNHVLQKKYSRAGWRAALHRMTADFGMADLEPDETALVLDYLARASK